MAAARSKRQVLWLCGVAAGAALLCFAAPSALAQDEPGRGARTTNDKPPGVEQLWKEYPLDPPEGAPASTQPDRTPSSTSVRDQTEGGFPTDVVMFLLVGVAIALMALLALSLTLAPRPKATSEGSSVDLDLKKFESQSLQPRSGPMSKPEHAYSESVTPDTREPGSPEPVDPEISADYTEVGEKVGAVLASAQEAAEQMLASARADAERIRSDAQEQAAKMTAAAKDEAERMQSESVKLRREADDYRDETHAAADGYAAGARAEGEAEAGRRVAEADEKAQAIVAEAEQRARHVEQEEARRQEALAAAAKRYEERLQSLLGVFRGMSTELEGLLHPARRDAEPKAEAPVSEALEDALRPERPQRARQT